MNDSNQPSQTTPVTVKHPRFLTDPEINITNWMLERAPDNGEHDADVGKLACRKASFSAHRAGLNVQY